MGWWGTDEKKDDKKDGKKRDEKKVPPSVTDYPMVAYVERMAPVAWRGIKVSGNLLESPFRNIFSIAELEERVANVAGGHDFIAKLHRQDDTTQYLGCCRFAVAAEPMINGEPIGKEKKSTEGKKGVDTIQAEIERTKAEAELDAAKAARDKKAKRLQVEDEDDKEETGIDDIESLREEVGDQIGEAIDGLKEVMLEKSQQERQDQQHRELLEAIKGGMESRSGGSGDLATVMSSQMEALKSIVAASSDANSAIMQAMDSNRKESATAMANVLSAMQGKSDDLIKMFLGQTNQHVATQLDTFRQLSENRGDNAQKGMDLMREGLSMGVALGMGRELDEQPRSLTDVLAGFTDKVADIAGKLIEQRGGGGLTKEGLKDIMSKVARKAIVRTKTAMSKKLPGSQQPAGVTGETAGASVRPVPSPTATQTNPQAAVPSGFKPSELQQAAMNAAIREWIKDLDERGDLDSSAWIQIGNRTLPVDMLQEFMAAHDDPGQWHGILQKYGDPDLVNELIAKVQKIVAQSEAQMQADVESAVADQFADQTSSADQADSSLEEHVEGEIKTQQESDKTAVPKKEPPTKIEPPEKEGAKAASSSNRPSPRKAVAKRSKKKRAGKSGK